MSEVEARVWPAVTIAEARRLLTAPGMPFETIALELAGRRVRAYKHAYPHLRAIFELSSRWREREFLIYENDRLTFDAHYGAVASLARVLSAQFGIKKGDRVAVAMRNYPEWSICFWAIVVCGGVVTPLNAWGTGDDLQYGIADSGASVIFADAERLERLQPYHDALAGVARIAIRTPPDARHGAIPLSDLIGPFDAYGTIADHSLPDVVLAPDDDATILYTSGTTGRPKGVLGSHRNIVSNILSIDYAAAFAAIRRGDPPPRLDDFNAPQKITLLPAPFFHVTGSHSTLVPAMAKGRKIVLMHKWNAERALALIERERINTTSGVPSMAWQMIESPDFPVRDLSSIEGMSYGGAAAAPELALQIAKVLPGILPRQAYGATETSSVSTSNSAEDYQRKPDSVGPAVPICDIRIVREDGTVAAPCESGEIEINGAHVAKGYWNNEKATAASFAGGWYRTGDVGRVDDEGFVYIMDRKKDMLIRGGENIYCVEIEAALMSHSSVLDAAVIGLPHRILGEEVGAVVQCKVGHHVDEAALRAHVAGLMASHKVPKTIDIRIHELPKNASGKTLKSVLRGELLSLVTVA